MEMESYGSDNISSNTLARIHGLLLSISPSERKIGEFILANHRAIPQMTLTEVAAESGVSDATAVRFFRSMGYKRWLDFKIALTMTREDTPNLIHEQITTGDNVCEVTEK